MREVAGVPRVLCDCRLRAVLMVAAFGLILALAGCGGDEATDAKAGAADAPAAKHLPIDWDGVVASDVRPDEATTALLAAEGLTPASVAVSTLPVLVPADPEVLRRLELKPFSHLYVGLSQFAGYAVAVRGVRSLGGDGVDTTPVNGSEKAKRTLTRWGAIYVVDVNCLEPETAARCEDPAFVDGLADSLVWIGPYAPLAEDAAGQAAQ